MSFAFKIPDQHLASSVPWDLAAPSLNGSLRAADGSPSLGSEAWPHPSTRASLPSSGLVQIPADSSLVPGLFLVYVYLSQLLNHQISEQGVALRAILGFSASGQAQVRRGTCP